MEHSQDWVATVLADPQCLSLVREYCHLAMRSHLSDAEADRLAHLLDLAESDGRLDFWFHEVDHFLDHALGLGSTTQIYASVNENFQSQLRELLDTPPASNETLNEELEDFKESLVRGTAAVQQHLKKQGYAFNQIDSFRATPSQVNRAQFQPIYHRQADHPNPDFSED